MLANDTDADGDPLTASLMSDVQHGTLVLHEDGTFDYTPDENFNGIDGFSYVVSDAEGPSSVATVTISITAINDLPVAVNDEYTTDEDTPLTIAAPGVLGNDTDVEGDPLTAAIVSGPVNGTVTMSSDGSFVYTPNADFNGTDGFSYLINDGAGDSAVASVTITVNAVNDDPVAVDDAYSTDEDTTLTVDAAAGVLANDTDADGDALTAALVSGPANGTLTLNADGSLSYTPNAGFTGTDSFSYQASDGTNLSNEATVMIDVQAATPVVRNVVGVNDRYTLEQDTTLSITAPGVLANDTDGDGDPLTAVLFSGVQHGSLTLNTDGSFEYTPEAGFVGTDSFVYRATDGANFSLLTAVTLRVTAAAPEPAPIPDPSPNPGGCHHEDDDPDEGSQGIAHSHVASMIAEGTFPGSDHAEDVLEDLIADQGQEDEESVDDIFTDIGQWS